MSAPPSDTPPITSLAASTSTVASATLTTTVSAPTLTHTRRTPAVRSTMASLGPSTSTTAVTATPTPNPTMTTSEMHLYLMLFHANLTNFYSAFIQNGGDDVQQLCDAQADQRELLEILGVVGMTKPLHEYSLNPQQFVAQTMSSVQRTVQPQQPTAPTTVVAPPQITMPFLIHNLPAGMHIASTLPPQMQQQQLQQQQQLIQQQQPSSSRQSDLQWPIASLLAAGQAAIRPSPKVQWLVPHQQPQPQAQLPPPSVTKRPKHSSSDSPSADVGVTMQPTPPRHTHPLKKRRIYGQQEQHSPVNPMALLGQMAMETAVAVDQPSTSGLQLPPNVLLAEETHSEVVSPAPVLVSLSDEEIARLVEVGAIFARPSLTLPEVASVARSAAIIGFSLKTYETKMVQNKKKITTEMLHILSLPPGEERLTQHRKHAAIYGRYDARKNKEKDLTFHENLVNESAAQICLWRPALLTRRDELFPLARQCVKDAGYHYIKTSNGRTAHIDMVDDVSMAALALAVEADPRHHASPIVSGGPSTSTVIGSAIQTLKRESSPSPRSPRLYQHAKRKEEPPKK